MIEEWIIDFALLCFLFMGLAALWLKAIDYIGKSITDFINDDDLTDLFDEREDEE